MGFFKKKRNEKEEEVLNKDRLEKEENEEEKLEIEEELLAFNKKKKSISLIIIGTAVLIVGAGAVGYYLYFNDSSSTNSLNTKQTRLIDKNLEKKNHIAIKENYQKSNKKENNNQKDISLKKIFIEAENRHKTEEHNKGHNNKIEKVSKNYKNIVIDTSDLSIPKKVDVVKKNGEVQIVFKEDDSVDDKLKKIVSQISLLENKINVVSKRLEDVNAINTQKILSLESNIKKVDRKTDNIDKRINNIDKKVNNVDDKLAKLNSRLNSINNMLSKQIANLNSLVSKKSDINITNFVKKEFVLKEIDQIKKYLNKLDKKFSSKIQLNSEEIKNLNKNISLINVKLKEMVVINQQIKNIEKQIRMLDALKKQIDKLKQVFQDSIQTNITLAKELKNLKEKYKRILEKIDSLQKNILKKSSNTHQITAHKMIDNSNSISQSRDIKTKQDYLNEFGFYYAGYTETNDGEVGYIADSKGRIYELRVGDVINGKYKVVEIKPLYIKLRNLGTSETFIITYKR